MPPSRQGFTISHDISRLAARNSLSSFKPRPQSVTGASRPSIAHLNCEPKRPKTLGSTSYTRDMGKITLFSAMVCTSWWCSVSPVLPFQLGLDSSYCGAPQVVQTSNFSGIDHMAVASALEWRPTKQTRSNVCQEWKFEQLQLGPCTHRGLLDLGLRALLRSEQCCFAGTIPGLHESPSQNIWKLSLNPSIPPFSQMYAFLMPNVPFLLSLVPCQRKISVHNLLCLQPSDPACPEGGQCLLCPEEVLLNAFAMSAHISINVRGSDWTLAGIVWKIQ